MPARFLPFEGNGSYDHSKCWYLDAHSFMQKRTKMRSQEFKTSQNVSFFEILQQCHGRAQMVQFYTASIYTNRLANIVCEAHSNLSIFL